MSFVCSDSCENGVTRENTLAKCSGKSPFSEYLWFKSNALEYSMRQMFGQTCYCLHYGARQVVCSKLTLLNTCKGEPSVGTSERSLPFHQHLLMQLRVCKGSYQNKHIQTDTLALLPLVKRQVFLSVPSHFPIVPIVFLRLHSQSIYASFFKIMRLLLGISLWGSLNKQNVKQCNFNHIQLSIWVVSVKVPTYPGQMPKTQLLMEPF